MQVLLGERGEECRVETKSDSAANVFRVEVDRRLDGRFIGLPLRALLS
jgi:hypothetical protein